MAGSVLFDEPLAQYTTYRIGGPARALVLPRSAEDVAAVLRFCKEAAIRWLPLGLGSNVLIDDAGFDGVVIRPPFCCQVVPMLHPHRDASPRRYRRPPEF